MHRLGVVVICLVGCTSSSDDGIATIPVGAYAGTGQMTGVQLVNGARIPFSIAPTITGVVTADGRYVWFSDHFGSPTTITQVDYGAGAVADGVFTAPNNQELGMYLDYDSNNFPPLYTDTNGAFSATAMTPGTLDATIAYVSANDSLTMSVALVAGSASPPAAALPATLTGTFTAHQGPGLSATNIFATAMLSIAADGTVTGTVTCPFVATPPPPDQSPCTVAGTLTARTDVDAYDATLAFANGVGNSFPDSWIIPAVSGLAYLDPSGKLRIEASSGAYAFAFTN